MHLIQGTFIRQNQSCKDNGLTTENKYRIMILYAVIFIGFGFIIDSPKEIFSGMYKILTEPDFLITDYIAIGGLGAAFINCGFVTLISIYIMYKLKIDMTGAAVAAIWLMSGFALFGKNILNIWLIMAGVWLYARFQKDKFSKYIFIALFGTSLAPLVTQVILGTDLPRIVGVILGIICGLVIGFILPPLATYLMRVHQGFNLYNIGFAAGIIGTIFISIFRSFGFTLDARMIWATGDNVLLGSFLSVLFLSMIILSYILDKEVFKKLKNLYNYSGRLVTDFIMLEGFAPTLLNMGINGIMATAYVIWVKGDLNGPTIGGIFTIVGFSAFGKHLKNMTPIFLGVFIGSIFKAWNINDPAILLGALFGTTLAPIAGTFGWIYGVIAGFIHSSVVLNVGYLHGGVNLYNNGFSGGIVAATLIPIIEALRRDE